MPNIKNLIALSDWLTYELETTYLDPPVLKVRLRPACGLVGLNVAQVDAKPSSVVVEMVLDAIVEWDLTENGAPLPCTEETKRRLVPFLRCLLAEKLKGEPSLLALALVAYAGNAENFLKN